MDKRYKIAELQEKDFKRFKQIEQQLKMELGKDVILIAYEKITE